MGVFARLLRRSKATEEASTAETQADIPTAESAAEEAAQAKGSTDVEGGAGTEVDSPAEAEAADSDTATATATAKGTDGSTATEDGEDAAAEGVEIPKQQSAAAAADHEAGEGART
ncbi:hypothetical protein [Streptomyces pseudovenezuelae]|uniref:Gliding motility protein n=1 Tax=Streptomyces pseudovenezuelae TaxID=67350 RepID=A0ABZ1X3M9_9ACTN|nr:hypothetical protein [Streptomyces pseudovenezuelae]